MPYAKDCPLNDRAFWAAVERWTFEGRTPRAINLTPATGVKGQHDGPDSRLADLASMAVCFEGESDIAVLEFAAGQRRMDREVCEALRAGQQVFRARRGGISDAGKQLRADPTAD